MNTAKMVLTLPAYQIANLVIYVSQKQAVAGRIASAAAFLPINDRYFGFLLGSSVVVSLMPFDRTSN